MSTGANQDRPEANAPNRAASSSLLLLRSRHPYIVAANDNSPDWRSIWARNIVRPLRRFASLPGLSALRRIARRALGFPD